jgi:hypothetical protein
MNYEIFGGFEIPRKSHKRAVAGPGDIQTFWKEVEAKHSGLQNAFGCYVFAIRAGRGTLPWYVGKTCKGFKRECFELHKLRHYDDALTDITRGTPLLYFVARVTPRGSFSTSPSEKEAAFVESTLIGMALKRNTALKNVSGAKFLSEIHVPGLVNPKKGVQPRHVREFTALF